jgi:NAD(P)-dependent dehydrogenase (short-subunit alcohol dehydrogenase family)
LIQDAASRHGRLDFLFNNAGIGYGGFIWGMTPETWGRIIDINLGGVIYGIDAALPIMREQGGGHIVNTASILGLLPGIYEAIYSTTKHAVVGLSEPLRFEQEDQGKRVSVVCPGAVATGIFPEGGTPPDAISSSEAAQIILAGVENNEGIIVLPEKMRQTWRDYWAPPEAFEGFFKEMISEKRRHHETSVSH